MACYELMGPPSARDLARKDGLCRRHPPQNWPAACDEALSSHSFIDQIRGFGLQSSLNSTCLRRCRRAGSSRVTLVLYRRRAFTTKLEVRRAMWRAFDTAVRRKPLAGAADAGRYGNSIDFCLKSLARRAVWEKGCY